jgi:hypothetical protein
MYTGLSSRKYHGPLEWSPEACEANRYTTLLSVTLRMKGRSLLRMSLSNTRTPSSVTTKLALLPAPVIV